MPDRHDEDLLHPGRKRRRASSLSRGTVPAVVPELPATRLPDRVEFTFDGVPIGMLVADGDDMVWWPAAAAMDGHEAEMPPLTPAQPRARTSRLFEPHGDY